jgi:hypothetical protein
VNNSKDEEITPIEREIDVNLKKMQEVGVTAPEYKSLMDNLERLNDMKTKSQSHSRISLDTLVIVGGNLLGIILIIAYEQKHVITSKSLNQLIRPR